MHHRLLLCHPSCYPWPQGQEVSYSENMCTYCMCSECLLGEGMAQLSAGGVGPLVLELETYRGGFLQAVFIEISDGS